MTYNNISNCHITDGLSPQDFSTRSLNIAEDTRIEVAYGADMQKVGLYCRLLAFISMNSQRSFCSTILLGNLQVRMSIP